MGSGRFSSATYAAATTTRRAKGIDDFHHSRSMISSGRYQIHEDLDPHGLIYRECRDSDEHPLALPIAVFFDVTGSMSMYPRVMQQKLPELFGVVDKAIPDPQIMVGAIGDAYSDRVPFQIGQFESDNRIDDQLRSILLEGGGGGGNHESYELAFYALARHTSTDAVEKRNRKGYAFIIGDERAYDTVNPRQVQQVFGAGTQDDLSTFDIVQEAKKKFDVFFVSALNHYREENRQYWEGLVGADHYLELDNPELVVDVVSDALIAAERKAAVASTP